MQRDFRRFISGFLLCVPLISAKAFSLLGPWASWQTETLGYRYGGDIGGPMILSEGYRWPIPIITYSYDASFLKFYGTNGVNALEAAIKVFNDLPDSDSMSADLSEFPLEQYRYHPTAGQLGLFDIKSAAMGLIFEQFYGAAAAERFTWTLRSQIVSPAGDPREYFSVVQRNYDPVTWAATPYVNNTLYSYTIFKELPTPVWQAVPFAVDSLAPSLTSLSGWIGVGGSDFEIRGFIRELAGGYFAGLTRDDVGQVRFKLRANNLNVETLFADVVGGFPTGGVGGSGSGSPWSPVFSITTTNTATGGGTSGTTNTIPIVRTALRPGVGKYRFVRVDYDSLLSATMTPYGVAWQDRYVTNGSFRTQSVSRVITHPDLLFGSGDYSVVSPIGAPILLIHTDTTGWVDNSAINTDGAIGEHYGPGVVGTLREIGFSNVGRAYLNYAPTGTGVGQQDATLGRTLSYFDGTTNTPVVFPVGNSLRAIENLALRGR